MDCPNLTVQSPDGNAAPIVYSPQVIAGEPPLRTQCSPASGSIFLLGNSTVTCSTTDSVGRTDSCSFTVTLAPPPKLSATRFMAFGNSITEGKSGDDGHIFVNNYPEDLRAMLAGRYSTQNITVVTKGLGGERATQGVNRLPHELSAVQTDVLLLEEGVNDLADQPPNIGPMVDALADMIQEAHARGIQNVFLATLLPPRPGGSKAIDLSLITAANDQIRAMAFYEGAILVDLYQGFGGSPDPYIGTDGLHPNEMGYQKMAQLFADAIRARLEVASGPASSMEFVRNMPTRNGPYATFR